MSNKNYFKKTAGLLATAVILSLTACGDKGGGGGNNNGAVVPATNGFQQCANCGNMTGAPFFTAESVDTYGVIRLNWNFTASAGTIGQGYPQQQYYGYNYGYNQNYGGGYYNNNQSQLNYVGQVGVQGTLNVLQTLNLGYCQLPAGAYTLATVNAGNWQYGMVSNLRMQAIGPVTVNLSLTQGQVSSSGYLQPGQISSSSASSGRLFANVMIESVNNYNCQLSVLVQ